MCPLPWRGLARRSLISPTPAAPACLLGPKGTNAVVSVVTGLFSISPATTTVLAGSINNTVTVSVTPGVNCSSPATVDIVSTAPGVAVPYGASGSTLTVTFPAGGASSIVVPIDARLASAAGSATFNFSNPTGPGGVTLGTVNTNTAVTVSCGTITLSSASYVVNAGQVNRGPDGRHLRGPEL